MTEEAKTTDAGALDANMSAAAPKPPRTARAAAAIAKAAAAAAASEPPPPPAPAPAAPPPPSMRADPDLDGDDIGEDGEVREVDFGAIGPGKARLEPASPVGQDTFPKGKRGPEYDPSDDLEVLETEDEVNAWIAENFPQGVKPIFFGTSELKLYAEKRTGFYRHWFNDVPGRIAQATRAGYKHVVDQATGRPIERTVGVAAEGGGRKAYLMETPLKWHKLALAEGQREIDRVDADILSGNIARKEGDERYVPQSGGKPAIKISRS